MELHLLYITTANREEAITISRELLGEHLIACANIVEHATSFYWWQGEIEQESEVLIVAKTQASHVPKVIERVKKLHSYSNPCIVVLPILTGSPEYLEWITYETTPKA